MKKYKVIVKNVMFRLKGKEYAGKQGDIMELPDHITTTALVERKRIEEYSGDEKVNYEPTPLPEMPEPKEETPKEPKKSKAPKTPPETPTPPDEVINP